MYRDRLWLNISGHENKELDVEDILSAQLLSTDVLEVELVSGKKIFLTPTEIEMDTRIVQNQLLSLINK